MRSLRRVGLLKLAGWARVFGAERVAQRWYEALEKEMPDDPQVLAAIGYLYAQQGRKREALARFDRIAAMSPRDAEANFNRGFLLQSLNDHQAAITAFERALEANSDHDRALYGLAISLISLKRLDEAVAPLERNTKLQPMSPYGWYQLGRVQHDRGKREKVEAIIAHLSKFEPKVAAQLARETGVAMPK
jgi:tetratricopeptide (TPR) repeat protein